MKRKEFLAEVVLRLIESRPTACVTEILEVANELTDGVFGTSQEPKQDWSKEVENTPASEIIKHLGIRFDRNGYGTRLQRVFNDIGIKTIGDILRIGRRSLGTYPEVGNGTLSKIDDVLYEVYDIETW